MRGGVRAYACVRVRVCVCACVRVPVCALCACAYVRVYLCMCTCTCTCILRVYVRLCVCLCLVGKEGGLEDVGGACGAVLLGGESAVLRGQAVSFRGGDAGGDAGGDNSMARAGLGNRRWAGQTVGTTIKRDG
jgi:hypothetical protein